MAQSLNPNWLRKHLVSKEEAPGVMPREGLDRGGVKERGTVSKIRVLLGVWSEAEGWPTGNR